ncbi:MAG: LPS-assembly protein LptD, partial [Bacteroidetes bacterium]|nr:LPS-assembly protein LptD [Bacteroidota bacterium]
MPDQLPRAINDYHALIARDFDAAEEQLGALRQMQIEQKVTFGDRPLADSLRPTFLTEATYNTVQDTVYLIRQAILIIAAAFFNDERILKADTVSYNRREDLLTATGNIVLLEPSGEVIFADHMELTGDFKNGIVENIRIRLTDDSRIAAVGGRPYPALTADGAVSLLVIGGS